MSKDEKILSVEIVKEWTKQISQVYQKISIFANTDQPIIGNILKDLQKEVEYTEQRKTKIVFVGRPRMGKSYITNYTLFYGLLKPEDLGKYPCPTSPGLQSTTKIPVKFVESNSNTIRLSVIVCNMNEYILRVHREMKDGDKKLEEFGLVEGYKMMDTDNSATQRIFHWMQHKNDTQIPHKVFELSNIEEGIKKSYEIINDITNFSRPYLRIWETAVDMIIISIPNDKLRLKEIIDVPGLSETNFRAKKIIDACQDSDIVVFVAGGESGCTLQDLHMLDSYNIINDTMVHPPFPIVIINETRSNNIPRGPNDYIDDIKRSGDEENIPLTFLESIRHRFLSDCRSDATVNSKSLFSQIITDHREPLFEELRENVSPMIFYPLYDDYNSVEVFWNLIYKGDASTRNHILRDRCIRKIRLAVSCLYTLLNQLKKKKRLSLSSSMKRSVHLNQISDSKSTILDITNQFKNEISLTIDEDIYSSIHNSLVLSFNRMNSTSLKNYSWNAFTSVLSSTLLEAFEDVVISSFYKEQSGNQPFLIQEISREFEYLINLINETEEQIGSPSDDTEIIKQSLYENSKHFIEDAKVLLPPPIGTVRSSISKIFTKELSLFYETYSHSLEQMLMQVKNNITKPDIIKFVHSITETFIQKCSTSLMHKICFKYLDLFIEKCSTFLIMIHDIIDNRNVIKDSVSVNFKINDLLHGIEQLRRALTEYRAAMPIGYQPEEINRPCVLYRTRRIADIEEDKSSSLHSLDQRFKRNGILRPNKNNFHDIDISVIDDNEDPKQELNIVTIHRKERKCFIPSSVIDALKHSIQSAQDLNLFIAIVADSSNNVDVVNYIDSNDPIHHKSVIIFYYDYDETLFQEVTNAFNITDNTTVLHVVIDPSPTSEVLMYALCLSFMKSLGKICNVSLCMFIPPNLIGTREYHKRTNILEVCSIHRSMITALRTYEYILRRQENSISEVLELQLNNEEAVEFGFDSYEDDDDENASDTIISRIFHQFSKDYPGDRKFYNICHDEKYKISKNPELLLKYITNPKILENLNHMLLLNSVQRIACIGVNGNRSSKTSRYNWEGSTFRETSSPSSFCLFNLEVLNGYNFIDDHELWNEKVDSSKSSLLSRKSISLTSIWKILISRLREDGLINYSLFVIQAITKESSTPTDSTSSLKRIDYIELLIKKTFKDASKKRGLPLFEVETLDQFNKDLTFDVSLRHSFFKKLESVGQEVDYYWVNDYNSDSLFGCLSMAIKGYRFASKDVRQIIIFELQRNYRYYIDFFLEREGFNASCLTKESKLKLYHEYIKQIILKKSYGDYLCLCAFSRAIGIDIVIYMANNKSGISYHRIYCDENKIEKEDGRITLVYISTKKSKFERFAPILPVNEMDSVPLLLITNKNSKKRKRSESTGDISNNIFFKKKKLLDIFPNLENMKISSDKLTSSQKVKINCWSIEQHQRIIEIASIYGTFRGKLTKEKLLSLLDYTNIYSEERDDHWIGGLETDDISNALGELRKLVMDHADIMTTSSPTNRHFTLVTTGRSIDLKSLQSIYIATNFFDSWDFEKYFPYINGVLEDDDLRLKFKEEAKNFDFPEKPEEGFPFEIFIFFAEQICKVGLNFSDKWNEVINIKSIFEKIEYYPNEEEMNQTIKYIQNVLDSPSHFRNIMKQIQKFFNESEYVEPITPRTRMRLELEKIRNQKILSHFDEVKSVYKDVEVNIKIDDNTMSKTMSTGESVSNIKLLLSENHNVNYSKLELKLIGGGENGEDVVMLDPLTLNDFKYVSEEKGPINIHVDIKE